MPDRQRARRQHGEQGRPARVAGGHIRRSFRDRHVQTGRSGLAGEGASHGPRHRDRVRIAGVDDDRDHRAAVEIDGDGGAVGIDAEDDRTGMRLWRPAWADRHRAVADLQRAGHRRATRVEGKSDTIDDEWDPAGELENGRAPSRDRDHGMVGFERRIVERDRAPAGAADDPLAGADRELASGVGPGDDGKVHE